MASAREVPTGESQLEGVDYFAKDLTAVGRKDADGWFLLIKKEKSIWVKEGETDRSRVETLAERFPGLGSGSDFIHGIDAISHINEWTLLVRGEKSVWTKEHSAEARPVQNLVDRFPGLTG
ncbi:hypothetical protein [Saccharothrix xinjiangensis]|uniref:Uncharacterized protein n=1 Tax=Saccharothrix xinjiangensis TaxID=204798 RepID=A0ABV9YDT3_9PSEU